MFNQQAIASTFLLFFLLLLFTLALEIGNRQHYWWAGIAWYIVALLFASLMIGHVVYLFVGA